MTKAIKYEDTVLIENILLEDYFLVQHVKMTSNAYLENVEGFV